MEEKRTERVMLRLTKSLHDKLKKEWFKRNLEDKSISMNSIVIEALEQQPWANETRKD